MSSDGFVGAGFAGCFAGDPAGLAAAGVGDDFTAGVGDVFGTALFAAGGVATFAFAAGVLGVGVGLAVFAGTGTRITPPSDGMNWLGLFGSIVITCPPGLM
jgi:hypothetical protein